MIECVVNSVATSGAPLKTNMGGLGSKVVAGQNGVAGLNSAVIISSQIV